MQWHLHGLCSCLCLGPLGLSRGPFLFGGPLPLFLLLLALQVCGGGVGVPLLRLALCWVGEQFLLLLIPFLKRRCNECILPKTATRMDTSRTNCRRSCASNFWWVRCRPHNAIHPGNTKATNGWRWLRGGGGAGLCLNGGAITSGLLQNCVQVAEILRSPAYRALAAEIPAPLPLWKEYLPCAHTIRVLRRFRTKAGPNGHLHRSSKCCSWRSLECIIAVPETPGMRALGTIQTDARCLLPAMPPLKWGIAKCAKKQCRTTRTPWKLKA